MTDKIETTGERIKGINKLVIVKMLEFSLSGNFKTYDEMVKACIHHFRILYNEGKTHRVLINNYNLSEIFLKFVCELDGFKEFLQTPENINIIKSLTSKPMAEEQPKEVKVDEVTKTIRKVFKHFTKKGLDFNESISETEKYISENHSDLNIDKSIILDTLCKSFYGVITKMKDDPFKMIISLMKLLSKEDIKQLITEAQAKLT